jgi:hypothetical protein
MKDLERQVGVKRAGDAGDDGGVAVDELNQPAHILLRARDEQAAVRVAEIDLHIDDEQAYRLAGVRRRRQVGFRGRGGDGGHVRVKEGSDTRGIIKTGK